MYRQAKYADLVCAPAITIQGKIRPPKDGERYFALLKVAEVNFDRPENSRNKILFENLTPISPNRSFNDGTWKWFD